MADRTRTGGRGGRDRRPSTPPRRDEPTGPKVSPGTRRSQRVDDEAQKRRKIQQANTKRRADEAAARQRAAEPELTAREKAKRAKDAEKGAERLQKIEEIRQKRLDQKAKKDADVARVRGEAAREAAERVEGEEEERAAIMRSKKAVTAKPKPKATKATQTKSTPAAPKPKATAGPQVFQAALASPDLPEEFKVRDQTFDYHQNVTALADEMMEQEVFDSLRQSLNSAAKELNRIMDEHNKVAELPDDVEDAVQNTRKAPSRKRLSVDDEEDAGGVPPAKKRKAGADVKKGAKKQVRKKRSK
ncbi:hypothetical protein LTR85_011230 [Meristemomyces frigidus]|nr:hypothetical protein LTR85_011230 [Meristemomyces frigidus]